MTISSTGQQDEVYQNLPHFPVYPAIQNKGGNPVQIQCIFNWYGLCCLWEFWYFIEIRWTDNKKVENENRIFKFKFTILHLQIQKQASIHCQQSCIPSVLQYNNNL